MKKVIRLTESDLHNIVKNSVNKILKEASFTRGYVSNDGNSMVGGSYGSSRFEEDFNVLDKFLNNFNLEDENEWDNFRLYCEQNEEAFNLKVTISSSYDESTGYGSESMPFNEIEDVSGADIALQYVSEYPNKEIAQLAIEVLKDTIDSIEAEDIEYFEDEYEPIDDDF